jgi:hypothetical protein
LTLTEAIERGRPIDRFAFEQFALCCNAAAEAASSGHRTTPVSYLDNLPSSKVFIKVHILSTLDGKLSCSLAVHPDMKLSEVLKSVCRRRRLDFLEYSLKQLDCKQDLPLDSTVGDLFEKEVCLVRRPTNDPLTSATDLLELPVRDSFLGVYKVGNFPSRNSTSTEGAFLEASRTGLF